MTKQHSLAAILILSLATLSSTAQDIQQLDLNQSAKSINEPPRVLSNAHPPGLASHREMFLPMEIGPADVDRYSRLMQLSEAQRRYFETYYEQYLERDELLKRRELSDLWLAAVESAKDGFPGVSMDAARRNTNLFRARDSYVRSLTALDDSLFAEVVAVLSPEQEVLLERVRLLRSRERIPLVGSEILAATVDLSQLREELERYPEFHAVDMEAFHSEILDYERLRTALLTAYWESRRRLMTRGIELLAKSRAASGEPERSLLMARYRSLHQGAGRIQLQLANLNERYLDRLSHYLTADAAKLLRASYMLNSYPRVYPNHHDARFLFDAVRNVEEISGELLELVDAIELRYVSDEDRLNQRMRRLSMEYEEMLALSPNRNPDEQRDFEMHITTLRQTRTEIAEQALEEVLAALPQETAETLVTAIRDFEQLLLAQPWHRHRPHATRAPMRGGRIVKE